MSRWSLVISGALILTWSQPAFAYVDPGSGAVLLQILISGITGAGIVFRKKLADLIRWIKSRVGSKLNG